MVTKKTLFLYGSTLVATHSAHVSKANFMASIPLKSSQTPSSSLLHLHQTKAIQHINRLKWLEVITRTHILVWQVFRADCLSDANPPLLSRLGFNTYKITPHHSVPWWQYIGSNYCNCWLIWGASSFVLHCKIKFPNVKNKILYSQKFYIPISPP